MKIDWLNLGGHDMEYQTVLDRLNASPYDELLEIDLETLRSPDKA